VVERTEPWGDFTYDAPVKVVTEALEGKRGYRWYFRCHALNTQTGSEWIEVFGGNRKHEGLRAFAIDEVEYIKPKKKRKKKNA
jgi:hypothetical protein